MANTRKPKVEITSFDERHLLLTITFEDTTWEHRFRTHAAANMAAKKRIAVHDDPRLGHKTLREFEAEWHRDYLASECAEATAVNYESCFRHLVLPRLGKLSLDQITPERVKIFCNELFSEGGCLNFNRGRTTLSAMLGVAESWGYITRNPVGRRRS